MTNIAYFKMLTLQQNYSICTPVQMCKIFTKDRLGGTKPICVHRYS